MKAIIVLYVSVVFAYCKQFCPFLSADIILSLRSQSHRKLHYANSPAVTNKKKRGLLIDLLAQDLLLPQEVMNINSRVS